MFSLAYALMRSTRGLRIFCHVSVMVDMFAEALASCWMRYSRTPMSSTIMLNPWAAFGSTQGLLAMVIASISFHLPIAWAESPSRAILPPWLVQRGRSGSSARERSQYLGSEQVSKMESKYSPSFHRSQDVASSRAARRSSQLPAKKSRTN